MDPEPISPSLPGVVALIKSGIQIYKEGFQTLFKLSASYVILMLLLVAAAAGAGFATKALHLTTGVSVGLLSLILLVLFILFYWLIFRISLGMMFTVREGAEHNHLSFKEAFARGKGRVWGFIGIALLTYFVIVGTIFVVMLAGSIIIALVAMYLHSLLIPTIFIVLIAGLFVTFFVTGTWFAFSPWAYIDQDARGLHALAVSKHLSHKHFWAILGRILCIMIAYVVIVLVLNVVCRIVFSLVPNPTGKILSEVVSGGLLVLTVIPVLIGTMFSLYKSAKASQVIETDSKDHGEHRGILITLAIIGGFGIVALPVVTSAILATLVVHHP
jgi:hypothetical protein